MSLQLTLCKMCGASCIWGVSRRGARVLVDATPSPDGSVRLEPGRDDEDPLAITVGGLLPPDVALYTNHAITCTYRSIKFRKPVRKL